MLWVIRRFAEERLGDAAAEARRRHADYYRRLGVEEGVWQARVAPHRLNEVAADYENLRVALAHHLEAGDLVEGLRLATAFANYAGQSGILVEGQTWLERFLAAAPDAPAELRVHALLSLSLAYNPVSSDASLRSAHAAVAESRTTTDRALIAEALCTTGRMHAVRMEREPALAAIEEALPIFEELGDRWGVAQCHEALGVVRRGSADDLAHYRRAVELYREVGAEHDLATTLFSMSFRSLLPNGLFDEARRALDESLARARGLGSRHVALHALTGLGQLARLEGDLDGATPMLEEALAGVRDAGDRRCTVRMLTALARIDLVRGESDRAWSGLHEAVAVAQQIDEGLSADTHETVDALGLLAMSVGEAELAARWLGAAEAIRSDHELLRPPPDQEAVDEAYRRLADRLGEERLTVLTEEGSRLSFAEFAAEVAASSLAGSD
jgi:tetratricopeptide (TPR) repeat protein